MSLLNQFKEVSLSMCNKCKEELHNMKIKFDVNMKEKVITLYFNEKEFEEWVDRAMKDHPTYSDKELADKGSKAISYFVGEVFEKIGKIVGVNLIEFTPNQKMYRHQAELPLQLREMKV